MNDVLPGIPRSHTSPMPTTVRSSRTKRLQACRLPASESQAPHLKNVGVYLASWRPRRLSLLKRTINRITRWKIKAACNPTKIGLLESEHDYSLETKSAVWLEASDRCYGWISRAWTRGGSHLHCDYHFSDPTTMLHTPSRSQHVSQLLCLGERAKFAAWKRQKTKMLHLPQSSNTFWRMDDQFRTTMPFCERRARNISEQLQDHWRAAKVKTYATSQKEQIKVQSDMRSDTIWKQCDESRSLQLRRSERLPRQLLLTDGC